MHDLLTITVKEYLDQKQIEYKEKGDQLLLCCLFNKCDDDSRPSQGHLYVQKVSGLYNCKKCGALGNLTTLAKALGDTPNILRKENPSSPDRPQTRKPMKKLTIELIEQCCQALPDRIRDYLLKRGISNEVLELSKIGWGKFDGYWWITIPIFDETGNPLFFRLRKDPDDSLNTTKMKQLADTKHTIYGLDMLKSSSSIFITEGELDRLVLLSEGLEAVTSTGGCMTFKEEWLPYFSHLKRVYVCYDRDLSGQTGARRTIEKLFALGGPEVYNVSLPDMGDPKKKDVTDFILSGGSIDDLIGCATLIIDPSQQRIIHVDPPAKPVTYSEWRSEIELLFPAFVDAAEACVAVILQLLIRDITNPFPLVLVDVPSAGKTITVNFTSTLLELVYGTDRFTPASFVSNATNVPKEKLEDIDLLPRIKYKTLLIRDMAPLFGERDDDLLKNMGTLTRVLDGEGYSTDSGTHGRRQYVGEYLFMMLAASTPITPRVWKVMGTLGSRLLFLRMNTPDKSEEELAAQLSENSCHDKELLCRKITADFIRTIWQQYPDGVTWDKAQDSLEVRKVIVRCASLLANLRGVVTVSDSHTNFNGDDNYMPPIIEKPDRIATLLYNQCRAYALEQGRTQLQLSDTAMTIRLAMDSAPYKRTKLLENLLDKGGSITTSEVRSILDCSHPTALKEMHTLVALKICYLIQMANDEFVLKLRDEHHWFLSDEYRQLRGYAPRITFAEADKLFNSTSNKANLTLYVTE